VEFFPSNLLKRTAVAVSQPAAGSDWSQTIGSTGLGLEGVGWLLKSVSGQIVQGATQVPQPILQITDPAGDVVYESFGASGAMTAGTTARFTWAPLLSLSALVGSTPNIHATAPLNDECFLPSGWVVKSVTLGIGANTQWQNLFLWVVQAG
jgi:hypothetical protein